MTHTKKRRASISSRVFDVIVYTLLVLVALVTIIPFLQVVTISMSPPEVVATYGLHLFPTKTDMEGYRAFSNTSCCGALTTTPSCGRRWARD